MERRTTIAVPVSIRDYLEEQKEYETQPLWFVLEKILKIHGLKVNETETKSVG